VFTNQKRSFTKPSILIIIKRAIKMWLEEIEEIIKPEIIVLGKTSQKLI
jgi:hypothetical protein